MQWGALPDRPPCDNRTREQLDMAILALLAVLAFVLLWHWHYGGGRFLTAVGRYLRHNRIDPM
jgi:hypothetical protein